LRYEACNSGLVLELQDKLVEKDRDIAEKDKDLAEKDKNLAEKDKNLAEFQRKMAKELKLAGVSLEKISKSTGVPLGEIETL
jgi:hypothetical protein